MLLPFPDSDEVCDSYKKQVELSTQRHRDNILPDTSYARFLGPFIIETSTLFLPALTEASFLHLLIDGGSPFLNEFATICSRHAFGIPSTVPLWLQVDPCSGRPNLLRQVWTTSYSHQGPVWCPRPRGTPKMPLQLWVPAKRAIPHTLVPTKAACYVYKKVNLIVSSNWRTGRPWQN